MKRILKTSAVLVLAVAAAAACTRRVQVESEPDQPNYMQTSAASAEVDVVGQYQYVAMDDGYEVERGPMTVSRTADGAYAVEFRLRDGTRIGTRNVRRSGNVMSMDVLAPDAAGTAELTWQSRNEVVGVVNVGETLSVRATRGS